MQETQFTLTQGQHKHLWNRKELTEKDVSLEILAAFAKLLLELELFYILRAQR